MSFSPVSTQRLTIAIIQEKSDLLFSKFYSTDLNYRPSYPFVTVLQA